MEYQKKRFISKSETEFLALLEKALPDYRISPQVAMGALLDPVGKFSRRANPHWARRKFSQKIVDFVVTDRLGHTVVAIIELDDLTHDNAEKKKLDAERDAMLNSAGYRTIRWDIRQLPSAEDIRRIVAGTGAPARAAGTTAALGPGEAEGAPQPPMQLSPSDRGPLRYAEPARPHGFPFILGVLLLAGGILVGMAYHQSARPPAVEAKPVSDAAKLEAANELLNRMGLALINSAPCLEWATGAVHKKANVPTMVWEGANRQCVFSGDLKFNQNMLDQPTYARLWNVRLRPHGACPAYAKWALEIADDPTWSNGQRSAALAKLYTDAENKGCLQDAVTMVRQHLGAVSQ